VGWETVHAGQVKPWEPSDDDGVTFAATLPGVLSARRLLELGCSERTVLQVLVEEVGLTLAEADAALACVRAPA